MTKRPVGRPPKSAGVVLREELVTATLAMLEKTGEPSEVTIAELCSAVDCTPPTLYHYWSSRTELLFEASELGWRQLCESQDEAAEKVQKGLTRLDARAWEYLKFASTRPALFRVLFLTPRVKGVIYEEQRIKVQANLEEAVELGELVDMPLDCLTLATWTAVHGLATHIALDNPVCEGKLRDAYEMVRHMIQYGLRRAEPALPSVPMLEGFFGEEKVKATAGL